MNLEQIAALLYCVSWMIMWGAIYRGLYVEGFSFPIFLAAGMFGAVCAVVFWALLAILALVIAVAFGFQPA